MDQKFIPLQPNLKFVSGLKEDLKTKYFELHEKAKGTLEEFFSTSLETLYLKLHKLLSENIESLVTIERLNEIISKHNYSIDYISPLNNPLSEILGSSPNCSLKSLVTTSNVEKIEEKKCSENNKRRQNIEKENLNVNVDIFTEDFLSDWDEENSKNHKSPVQSVVSTPVKVQSSPVFNKRKRSRKNHSLASNNSSHSLTSSNDSKISLTNAVNNASILEKNVIEIDTESDKEIEKEQCNEPLKPIDNTYASSCTPSRQQPSKESKLLSVSKTSYGKTDFFEKGKRLRQTTLTLKKATPVIDISKDLNETNCSINDSKSTDDAVWNKSFPYKEKSIKNAKEYNFSKKPWKAKEDLKNSSFQISSKDGNASVNDDEVIETSPAYNEKSKLKNKLGFSKRPETKLKIQTQHVTTDSETVDLENIIKQNSSKYTQKTINSNLKLNDPKTNALTDNAPISQQTKSFELQRSLSDDTYFSLAELSANKNDLTDCDMTEYEDEGNHETPPAKRMLLSSFDIIPGRQEKSPDYAYKEAPVRNKNERAQLPGWDCRDCKMWYGNLTEEERKKKQNQCSRHRGKYKADILTPESFWNPVFDDTNGSSADD